jgi:hypothetical protein
LTQAELGIGNFVFVPPSGRDGPAYPTDIPDQTEPGPDEKIAIDYREDETFATEDVQALRYAVQSRDTKVHFLPQGAPITVRPGFWEFIPFNDDTDLDITGEFVKAVEEQRESLLSDTANSSLKKLKEAYDKHFGSTGKNRNKISLFLYSGPIYSVWKNCEMIKGSSRSCAQDWRRIRWLYPDMLLWDLSASPNERNRPRCSVLYSGDGYLNTRKKLSRLRRYIHEKRINRVGVFQVMHHGARDNWHQGVAASISPLFSVFSSDPEHKGLRHPAAAVLRDFWPYGAVQVDKESSFRARGFLEK